MNYLLHTMMSRTSIIAADLIYASKLGTFCLRGQEKGSALWNIKWEPGVEAKIKQENGRIYFIFVDEAIYKIGCSECKGGMKTTFSFYKGGLGGSPSLRTFGIHLLIHEQLEANKKVELYGIWNESIQVPVKGLFGEQLETIFPSIKSMEDKCRTEYKHVYGKYPPWNFQENGEQWPHNIQTKYKAQVQQRGISNKKNLFEDIEEI